MFEFFKGKGEKKDKIKNDKTPSTCLTDGVQSVLLYPVITGSKIDFNTVLSGEQDWYWSKNKKNNMDAIFFDTYEDLQNYLKSSKGKNPYNMRAAVFFFGPSQKDLNTLFQENKFSELVRRATHVDDLYSGGKIYENTRFNPSLVSSSAQKK